jgi:hypothetical protein
VAAQALAWLRADLARWQDPKNHPAPPSRRTAAATLAHWQKDPDLAAVRGDDALARLPEPERADWRKLWSDVEAARRRAGD